MAKNALPKKVKIHWWEDFYGTSSCHLNVPGLSYQESFIGEIRPESGCCFSRLKGEESWTSHKNQPLARRRVMDSVNGEPVDIWD